MYRISVDNKLKPILSFALYLLAPIGLFYDTIPSMTEKIIAPCISIGEVRSVWNTDVDGGDPGMYAMEDNDSKDAECRCIFGTCCVNGKNEVIQGIVLTVGGPKNLKQTTT